MPLILQLGYSSRRMVRMQLPRLVGFGAVGLGWLLAPTRLPGLKQLADFVYRRFAKNRLRLTGRCGPDGCAIEPTPTRHAA